MRRDNAYDLGFANSPLNAKYPSLWRGLEGFWCAPIPGQSDLTDFSRPISTRNNGTFAGAAPPVWVRPNEVPYAVNFPGVTGYSEIPTNTRYNSSVGSFSCWFKVRVMPAGNGDAIMARSTTTGLSGIDVAIFGNHIFCENHSTSAVVEVAGPTFAAGEWHHFVYNWTQANGGVNELYWDGRLYATSTNSFAWTWGTTTFRLADPTDTWWEVFDGQMANVGWFSRWQTPDESQRQYTDWASPLVLRKSWVPTWDVAGIVFDSASNGEYTAAANTDTWSHTNVGNYLIVGVPMLGVANVTSVTFNGDALTLLGSRTSAGSLLRVELWGMVAPDIGTFDIVVNLDGSIAFAGVASSWSGIHQTSPTEGFNSATATNVGAADATVDITSVADNCVIVDVMASSDGSVTVGAGQTSRNNVTGAAGSGTMSSEGPKTPAGAVTMSWTDIGALATWVTGGIALRPLAADSLAGMLFRHPGMDGLSSNLLVGGCRA